MTKQSRRSAAWLVGVTLATAVAGAVSIAEARLAPGADLRWVAPIRYGGIALAVVFLLVYVSGLRDIKH